MNLDIVRAWKDSLYRRSLSEEQRSQLPANPVEDLDDHELLEEEMDRVRGSDLSNIAIAGAAFVMFASDLSGFPRNDSLGIVCGMTTDPLLQFNSGTNGAINHRD